MTRKFVLIAAAAGLALPLASRAQEAAAQQAPAAASSPAWIIRCPGLTPSVPLTADSAQSLPMHLVATLNCGDLVSVLSDAEGYTVNVRTADGKTGYVAGMYLAKAPAARPATVAVAKPAAPVAATKPAPRVAPASAIVRDGVARWRRGMQGCEQLTKDGIVVESLTADGVTVQVSLRDLGAKLRASIVVDNTSSEYVYVNPIGITLESRGEHWKSLAVVTPQQMATEMAQQATGSEPAPVVAELKSSDDSSLFPTVAYNAPAPRRAGEEEPSEQEPSQVLIRAAKQFNAEALKKGVVKPDGKTTGAVWFERDANPDQYVMRVPIDNEVFEFPLSLAQPN
jgi:hypothetical protein